MSDPDETQALPGGRSPIFEAVDRLVPGIWNRPGSIPAMDRAIDRALGKQVEIVVEGHRLGSVAEKYESAGRGPGTVSGGQGDPGGVSYGTYQLASRTGTAGKFVAAEGRPWAKELSERPGSPAFSKAWRLIAARDPDQFERAQHEFIRRTHYEPVLDKVKAATGVDIDTLPAAVREAAWSCSVQHGGAAQILIAAIEQAGADDPRALVSEIYKARQAYVTRVANRSGAASRRTLMSVVNNRYPRELRDILELLA